VFVYYIFKVSLTFGSKGRSLPLPRDTVKLRDVGLRLNVMKKLSLDTLAYSIALSVMYINIFGIILNVTECYSRMLHVTT
jgi:hypothetical protein